MRHRIEGGREAARRTRSKSIILQKHQIDHPRVPSEVRKSRKPDCRTRKRTRPSSELLLDETTRGLREGNGKIIKVERENGITTALENELLKAQEILNFNSEKSGSLRMAQIQLGQ